MISGRAWNAGMRRGADSGFQALEAGRPSHHIAQMLGEARSTPYPVACPTGRRGRKGSEHDPCSQGGPARLFMISRMVYGSGGGRHTAADGVSGNGDTERRVHDLCALGSTRHDH
jgi:hypothetical protein